MIARRLRFVALAIILTAPAFQAQSAPQLEAIQYTLRVPAPESNIAEIEARIPTGNEAALDLMLPVWTPGFYRWRTTMTKKELSALAKRLLPALPTFDVDRSLLFVRPIGHTIRGIDLDRSSDPRGFYVTVFLQPLCVPAEVIFYNAGWRLGGGTHTWHVDTPGLVEDLQDALTRKALPFLEPLKSPRDVALAAKLLGKSKDAVTQQVVAYSFARSGDIPQATRALDQLLELMTGDDRPWVREKSDQVAALKTVLLKQPSEAQRQLSAWEDQTARALGLERFRYNAAAATGSC